MTAGSTAHLLDESDGRELLRIARRSLEENVAGSGDGAGSPPAVSGRLAGERRGVFVTLTRAGELRGCTGYVEGIRPLPEAVWNLAESSALRDTRFPPVAADEVDALRIEISVLTPPRPIAADAVEIGKHGLIIRRGSRSGLLLPQVPLDWGWDREQFLDNTCRKAGLPRDSWKAADTEILGFEAQIFQESDS